MGYSLSLERLAAPSPTAIPINFGETLTGIIDPRGEMDLFVMNGLAGDVVVVQAASTSTPDPCVEVFDPAGVRIASQCRNQSARVEVTLTSSGPHTVLLTEWNNDRTMGYSLTTQCFGTCPRIGPNPGQTMRRLTVTPAGLFFTLLENSDAGVRILNASNAGSEAIDYTVSAETTTGGGWLAVSPSSGNLNPSQRVSLAVTASPSSLGPGTYSGRLTFRSATSGETVVIPVTLSVSASTRRIILSQTGITFRAVQGSAPAAQNVRVLNSGSEPLNWSAAAATLSGGAGWLSIDPASGTTDAGNPRPPVNIRVDPGGLAPGQYHGQVLVSASGVDNSPQAASIILQVLPQDAAPGAEVNPIGLIFVGEPGGEDPAAQQIIVSNPTTGPLTFTTTASFDDGPAWFSHDPAAAAVLPGNPITVEVRPSLAALGAGVFRGRLEFRFAEDGAVREVELLLVVAPGAGAPLQSSATGLPNAANQSLCTPSELLPVFRRFGSNFRTTAGWPTQIEVGVVDDCGSPMVEGAVLVSFSNGDPPFGLTRLGDGGWTGSWAFRDATLDELTVTARALMVEPDIQGETEVSLDLLTDSEVPIIGSGAVVSAASFLPQAPLAPGSLISIFGQRLAAGQAISQSLPLETELATTSLRVGDRLMPLLFVSDSQVNAMIPYGVPANTQHQVILQRGRTFAFGEPITLADAQPAIFSLDQTGEGQAIIIRGDGQLARPGSAVKKGDAVVVYAAGLGALEPALLAGFPAPSDPLSRVASPIQLTIGGAEAEVFFAGSTPGFTGLYQINAYVPGTAPSGEAVEVVLTVANQLSRPTTIAIE